MIGSRTPSKLNDWKAKAGDHGQIGNFEETAKFGDAIVLAVQGSAAEAALQIAGAANLKGKTVIDATNPIAAAPPENGVLQFFTELNKSLMERLQASYPEAYFVKAFSCVGNAWFVNPDFPGGPPTMFICGNHEPAKQQVTVILEQFGWAWEDMGSVEAARAIEPLCMLWCIPGLLHNQWAHAFKLLKQA
jgi:predicted dinucleotide-binding enzyme